MCIYCILVTHLFLEFLKCLNRKYMCLPVFVVVVEIRAQTVLEYHNAAQLALAILLLLLTECWGGRWAPLCSADFLRKLT